MAGNDALFPDLCGELRKLKRNLNQYYRDKRWSEFSRALDTLAKIGEGQGQIEICLRAQSLQELTGHRRNGRLKVADRVDELFDQLMKQLSYLQWKSQLSH